MGPLLGGLASLASLLYPEESEAVNIPASLLKMTGLAKKASGDFAKGASREEVYNSTGLIPFSELPRDVMLYRPTPEGALKGPALTPKQYDNLTRGKPIIHQLGEVYDDPEFYDLVKNQNLKSLPVIRDPRNTLGWLNGADASYIPYSPWGDTELIFLRRHPGATNSINPQLGLSTPSENFSPLIHELNHSLGHRGGSSAHFNKDTKWGGRIQEAIAELGSGDLSPLEAIKLLNNWKGSSSKTFQLKSPQKGHSSLTLQE